MKVPTFSFSFRKPTETETAPQVILTPRGWNDELGGYYPTREEMRIQAEAVALYKKLGNKFANAEHERIYRNRRKIDDWKPKNPFEDPNFYNNVIEDEWSTPPQPAWPEEFLETGEPVLPGPRLIGETIPWNWVYIFCGMIIWWCLHWTFVYYHDRRIKLYNLGTYRKAFGIPRSDNRPWEVAIAAARQRQKDKENRLRVKAGLHPLWDNPVTGKTEKLEEWDEYGHPIPPLPTKAELAKEEAEWDRWWSKIVRRVEQFDKRGYNLMPGALVDFAMDLYFTEWEEGMVLEDAFQPPEPAPVEPAPELRERSASPKETRSRIEVIKPGQSVRHRLPDPARAPVEQADAQSTSSKRSNHSAPARKTPAYEQPRPPVDEEEAATQRILASIRRKEQKKQRESQNRPQVLGHKINPPRVPPPVSDPNVPLWFGMDARRFTHMVDDDGMIIEFQNPWLQTSAEREGTTVKDVEMHDATREKKKREAKSAPSSKGVKRNRDEFASSTDAAASAKKKSKGLNGLATPSKEATSKAGRSSRKADESGAEVPPTVEDMTTTQDQEPPEPIEYLEEDGVTSTHPSCRGVKVGYAWAKGEWGFRVGALGQPERLCFAIVRKKPLRPGSFIGPDEEAHLWLTEDEYVRARDHHELPSETHDIIKLGPINPREGLKPRLLATGRRILNDKEILGNGRTDGIRQPKEGEVVKGNPNSERFLSPPRTPEERFMLPLQRQAHRKKQKELAQKERTAQQERKKQEAERLEAEKKEAERVKAEQDEVKRKALAKKEAERRKILQRIEEKSRSEPLARVEVPWETLKDMATMGYEPSGGTVLIRDGIRVDIHGNPYKEEPETKGKERERTTPSPPAATPKQRTVSGSSSTTTTAVESASQSQPSSSPAKTVSFATTPTAVSVSTPPATIKEDKSAVLPSPPAPIPALTVTSPTPPRIFRQPSQAPILTPASLSVQLPQFTPVPTVSSFVPQPANHFTLPTVTHQVIQPMDLTPTPPSSIQSAHVGSGFNPSAFPANTMQSIPSAQINPSLFAQPQLAPVATPSLNMFAQVQPNLFTRPPTHAASFSPLPSSHPTQSAPISQPFGQGFAPSTSFSGPSISGFGQPPSTLSAPGPSHVPMNVEPATGSLSQPFGTSSIGAGVGGMLPIQAMPVFTPPVSLPDIYNRPMSKKGAVPRDLRKRPASNLTHAPAQSSPLAAPQTPETPSHGLVFMEGEGAGSVPSLDNFAHEGKYGTLQAVYGIAVEGQAVGSDVNGSNEEFEEVAGQVPKDLNSYILQDRVYEEIDPCAPKSGSPGPSSITPATGSSSFPLPGGSTPGTPTMGTFSTFLKSASGQHLVAQYNSNPNAPRLRVGGPLSDATSSQQEIEARPKATNSRLQRGTAPRPNVQNLVVQPTVPTPTANASTPSFPLLPSQPFMQFAQQQQAGAGPFFAFNPPTGPTLSLANNAFVQGMANTMDRARAEERAAPNHNTAFTFGR